MPNITFIPSPHKYINDEGRELISVSSFIDSFREPVDWKVIAKRKAAKMSKAGQPTTGPQLLKQWKTKGEKSAEIGTLFHSIQEEQLIHDPSPVFYGRTCRTEAGHYKAGHKVSIPINTLHNDTVYPELMIYDTDHMICGQSDKVIVTDKIPMRSYSSEWVSPKYLLPPISHLEDCAGVLYSLRMSLYMYMLWKANKGTLLPGDIIIEHATFKRDLDGLPILINSKPVALSLKQISLPYRKKEIIAMLKTI